MTKEFITYDTVTTHLPTAVEDRITTIAGSSGGGAGTVTSVAGVDPDVSGDVPSADLAAALGVGDGAFGEAVHTVSASGSAVTLPAPTTATINKITLSANCAITLASGFDDTKAYSFLIDVRQPASGGSYAFTASLVGTIHYLDGGTPPIAATGQGALTRYTATTEDGGATYEVSASVPNAGNQRVVLTIDGSGHVAVPADAGDTFYLVLTQNVTMDAPTGLTESKMLLFRIKQDATGGRTINWNSIYNWGSAGPIFLSSSGNKKDYAGGIYDSVDSKVDMIATRPGF